MILFVDQAVVHLTLLMLKQVILLYMGIAVVIELPGLTPSQLDRGGNYESLY